MKHYFKSFIVCLLLGMTFVSCTKKAENREPIVSALTEEGLTSSDTVINPNSTLKFGFEASRNPDSQSPLTQLRLFISDGHAPIYDTTYSIHGENSFKAYGEYTFTEDNYRDWQIIGRAYDEAGEYGSAYINVKVQMPHETFKWQQVGDSLKGYNYENLLSWNVSEDAKNICLAPSDTLNVFIYKFDNSQWNSIVSPADEEALYKAIIKKPKDYKNNKLKVYDAISLTDDEMTYNDVIFVMDTLTSNYVMLKVEESFHETYQGISHLTVNGKVKP